MDKSSKIDITVLMPAYNAEKHLEEAIDSILNQTFRDFQLMVINDGSADRTEEIIKAYQKKDARVRYEKNEKNLGLVGVLAKGVNLTNTKYLVRMDADDIAFPDRLDKQYRFMESNPEIVASGSIMELFGSKNVIKKIETDHDDLRVRLLFRPCFFHPTVMMRNDVLKKENLNYRSPNFLETKEYVWPEDYDLWYQLSKAGRIANLPDCLLKYRMDGQNISFREVDKRSRRYKNFYKTIFEELGLEANEKNLDLHYELVQGKTISHPVEDYKNWIEHIKRANEQKGLFEKEALEKQLTTFWKSFFYKCADKKFGLASQYLKLEGYKGQYLSYIFSSFFKKVG